MMRFTNITILITNFLLKVKLNKKVNLLSSDGKLY
jgi:hypothetical protein